MALAKCRLLVHCFKFLMSHSHCPGCVQECDYHSLSNEHASISGRCSIHHVLSGPYLKYAIAHMTVSSTFPTYVHITRQWERSNNKIHTCTHGVHQKPWAISSLCTCRSSVHMRYQTRVVLCTSVPSLIVRNAKL